jgi:hypothetical protein
MDVPEVKPIELTAEEAALRKHMEEDFSCDRPYTGQYACRLFESLRNRKAIPQVRLNTFTKPFPGGRGKSHLDVFKQNNHSGKPICELGTFVKYLHYFIDGPDLPVGTIEGFRQIMLDDAGTTGEVMSQLTKFVRSATRRLRLSRDDARERFWKLALEVGYQHDGSIRDAAGSAGK